MIESLLQKNEALEQEKANINSELKNIKSELKDIKSELKDIKSELKDINSKLKIEGMIPISDAAPLIGLTKETLRQRIRHAKAFPKESPYKEGIHWESKPAGSQFWYYVDPKRWGEVTA